MCLVSYFQTFRRLLISKLQDEFENRARNVERKILSRVCRFNILQDMYLYCNVFFLFSFSLYLLVFDKHDNELTAEEEEQRAIAKIKMLGNIKFIGELGKLNLIHESILHKCIKTVGFSELIYSRLFKLVPPVLIRCVKK